MNGTTLGLERNTVTDAKLPLLCMPFDRLGKHAMLRYEMHFGPNGLGEMAQEELNEARDPNVDMM